MKSLTAKSLVRKVKQDYDFISEEFSSSRFKGWYEFGIYKELSKEKGKVLDIGCGNGRLLKALHGRKVEYLGVDISKGLIDQAKKNFKGKKYVGEDGEEIKIDSKTKFKFEVGTFNKIPMKASSVDSVFSVAAFHHLPGKDMRLKALDEVARVLKPGGVFAFSVWNLFQPRWRHLVWESCRPSRLMKYDFGDCFVKWKDSGVERYYHSFTPWEMRALLKKSKLALVDEIYVTKKGRVDKWWQSENMVFVCRLGEYDG